MARRGSARRHAQAVFQIFQQRQGLEGGLQELQQVAQAATDPALRLLLESPRLSLTVKVGLLREKLPGVSELTLNFAGLLVARGRLALAQGVAEEYLRLLDTHRGLEHAQLTTAIPLEEAEAQALGRRLGERLGKRLVVQAQVDPAIIGGLVVRVGDQLLDGSTLTKLELLKKDLALGGPDLRGQATQGR